MDRPLTIARFERGYLGALAIGLLNTAFNWRRTAETAEARQAEQLIGSWYLPTIAVLGFLIPLALWYFIARRGSVLAKWIATVFTSFGVTGALFALARGNYPTTLSLVLSLIALALQAYAIAMLFRPDARPWFGAKDEAASPYRGLEP